MKHKINLKKFKKIYLFGDFILRGNIVVLEWNVPKGFLCASIFVKQLASIKEDDKKMDAHATYVVQTSITTATYSVQKLSCTRRHA